MTQEPNFLETKYWYLRDHHLFSTLNKGQLNMVCLISRFKSAKKGEIIYFADEDSSRVYLLKQGTIKIVGIDEKGDEVVKDLIQKGDLFGQFDLGNEHLNDYAVAVSESVSLCSFKMEDFENMIEEYPQVALKYTKWLGFRFKRLQNRYSNLMFKDVRTRFELFLKEWAEAEAEYLDGDRVLKNYLTHQDIASLVCSTRQTVTQLFNEFKESGRIDYTRSFIKIKNL